MSIIRNLSLSNILLDDLGGITILASSDYDLKYETHMDIFNSNDLNTSITTGDIVFIDNDGNQLTLQESLNTQSNISPTGPAIIIQNNGTNISGAPHNVLNFSNPSGINITGTAPGVANIDLAPKLGIDTIGNNQVLTLTDPLRSNKVLSVQKVNYIFYRFTISNLTYLVYSYLASGGLVEGLLVPENATIVGASVMWLGGSTAGASYEYDLYADKVLHTSNIFSSSGNTQLVFTDNTLNIDVNAMQRLQVRARNVGNGGTQSSVTANLFIRWRV